MKSKKAGSRTEKNKSKRLFGGSSDSLDNAPRGVSFDDGKEKPLNTRAEPKKSSSSSKNKNTELKKPGVSPYRTDNPRYLALACLIPIAGIFIYAGATGQLSGNSNSGTTAYA